MNSPTRVALDAAGRLFVADTGNHLVRQVEVGGVIQAVAGDGVASFDGDDGSAVGAGLSGPTGVAIDGAGDLYIADSGNARIRRVAGVGAPTPVTGGAFTYPQDEVPPRVLATWPGDGATNIDPVRLAQSGVVLAFDQTIDDGFLRSLVLQGGLPMSWPMTWDVDRTRLALVPGSQPLYGTSYTVLVSQIADLFGNEGDPAEITFTTRVDQGSEPDGAIETVAGTGNPEDGGDAGSATQTPLAAPADVAVDKEGNVYISDSGNHRIWKVDPSGAISTVAGTGEAGSAGDDGPASEALLSDPAGIAVDDDGNLYIADKGNDRVRKVDSSGTMSTVAGGDEAGFSGDDGPASEASLKAPVDVAVDTSGNLYISDSGNHRIRKVDAESGSISTVVGNGSPYSSGDGAAGTDAGVGDLRGVFVDDAGVVYFVDNGSIRRMDGKGMVDKVAGSGNVSDPLGDGGPATEARLSAEDVYVDPYGNIFVSDIGRVRLVAGDTRAITTIAGTGDTEGFTGDGGPATDAGLGPSGLTVDDKGDLYVADSANDLVRRVDGVTEPAPDPDDVPDGTPEEPSDFDGDGRVAFSDFVAFGVRYGLSEADEGYDSVYDLNDSGAIDFADYLIFLNAYGGG